MKRGIEAFLDNGVTYDNAVGICHNIKHYGYLSDYLIEKHECLIKQCPLLKRVEGRQYWYAYDIRKLLRKIRKDGKGHICINGRIFKGKVDVNRLSKYCKREYSQNKQDPVINIVYDD